MFQRLRNTVASLLNRAGSTVADSAAGVGAFVSGSAGALGQDDPAWILGNPLRGLTPDRAANMIESWIRGEFRDTQWLLFLIEQLDADILTLACRRTAALKELSWTIRTNDELAEDKGLQQLAEDQQEALEARYEDFENLPEAVGHLGTAFLRKYALVSIQGNRFVPIDQWWFLRRGLFGPWHYNPDLRYSSARGMPEASLVDETQYLVRDSERSMFWIALLKFVRANRSQKWWDKFCEIASRNGTVIIGPPGMTPDQAAMFKSDALGIATGGSGVLPNGSDIKATGPQRQGPAPYMEHMTFLREQVVLAGTGGLLTMITAPTGLGSNTGDQHADAFRTLRNADAGEISAEFRRKIDAPLLAAQFPGQPVLAYFELDTAEQQSPSAFLDDAVKAKNAGFQMDAQQLSEKTGYTLTLAAVPVLPGPVPEPAPGAGLSGPLLNRAPGADRVRDLTALLAFQLGVPQGWLKPVADLLADLEAKTADQAVSDADLLAFAESAAARLPELFGAMDVNALADVFEKAMGAAALEGARSGLRKSADAQPKT